MILLKNAEIIDVLAVRIVNLKNELAQITIRRNDALRIIEEQREEIRKLKTQLKELNNE